MPTILHLRTVTGRGGGPEKTLLNSQRFIGADYKLRLAYIRPEKDELYDMPARAAETGSTLIDIPERHGLDPRTWTRLTREIKTSQPALLHAHDYKTNVLAVLLGRMFKRPVMTTMHGYVSRSGRLDFYYRIDRWALRRMDRIVAVSPDLLELSLRLGIASSKCVLIDNAIDVEQFARRQTVHEAKRRLGIAPERLLIGAVGRLSAEKGFDRLIEALARIAATAPDVELVIVGEGAQRPELERLIDERGIADRVRLAGYQANTIDWFQAMDIFALSSLREGLPNVVLEAMAMEVPVIATRIAGVPRILEHEVNGLLVEPGDVEGLCHALRTLTANPTLRAQLARAGRQTVEQDFSFAVRMQKIRAIYEELLQKSAPRDGETAEGAAEHAV